MAGIRSSAYSPRFVRAEEVEKMRRIREREGLAWAIIGQRFGISGDMAKRHVKGTTSVRKQPEETANAGE